MLIGLGDAAPAIDDAKAAFVEGALNCMSHQTPITNGIANITAIVRRAVCRVLAENSGGKGTAMVKRRQKRQPTTTKPAKMRIDVRAHDRRRNSPTEVHIPMTANAAHIAAAAITNWGALGGCGCVVTKERDAIERTANSSAMMLPRAATIALTVMPTGLLMRIIYPLFFSVICR
jgi:hypothetical protein